MKNKKLYLKSLVALLALVLVDQVTKYAAYCTRRGKSDKVIINNFIDITYLENRGAAFSMLQNKMVFFYILTILIIILSVYVLIKMPKTVKYIKLYFTILVFLAGAIGNLIDRVIHQYVIDFIYIVAINFPVFNVADIYVTCSLVYAIILVIFVYKEDSDFDFIKFKK